MTILSWNVNGLWARIEAMNRTAPELHSDAICLQKVWSKGASPFLKPTVHINSEECQCAECQCAKNRYVQIIVVDCYFNNLNE